MRIEVFIVIVVVLFIFQRTHPSILRLRIYKSGTISYDPSWNMDN
jgi:hypothetical protein